MNYFPYDKDYKVVLIPICIDRKGGNDHAEITQVQEMCCIQEQRRVQLHA